MADHDTLTNFGPAVLAVMHTMLEAGAEAAEGLSDDASSALLMSAIALMWFHAVNDEAHGARKLYERIEANGAAFMAGMVSGARDAGRVLRDGSGKRAGAGPKVRPGCERTDLKPSGGLVPLHEAGS